MCGREPQSSLCNWKLHERQGTGNDARVIPEGQRSYRDDHSDRHDQSVRLTACSHPSCGNPSTAFPEKQCTQMRTGLCGLSAKHSFQGISFVVSKNICRSIDRIKLN